ncbi:MAG: hypothetical protein CFE33_20805 [Pseudorhodobacter sp. PARRP1]|nr:MAG: hypothetical protein CFE33_20805 [Pseudorhodobacter sp. PARRP1]
MKNGRAVVLVVEDSPLIRMGAVELVLSAGYEVLEAQDADEAIRILESRNDIGLVFTDVHGPSTVLLNCSLEPQSLTFNFTLRFEKRFAVATTAVQTPTIANECVQGARS